MHAKFTRAEKRYVTGATIKALSSISQQDCVVSCVSEFSCVVVNYKRDGSSCELISSINSNVANDAWDVFSSDLNNDYIIGQICEQINPCASNQYCRDVCGANNQHTYVCLANKNAALNGAFTQSSYFDETQFPAKAAIDGNYQTTSISDIETTVWMKLDLKYVYKVNQIKIYNRFDCCYERQAGYFLLVAMYDKEVYYTKIGVLTGIYTEVFSIKENIQFVFITKTPAVEYLQIGELEVYV